ncbi:MAG TPA: hypothetical protein VGO37_20550 [Steroidobacteraceae bacterium]|jgi:hypothetical protein|nr:hypothetical protein [Steroidobacteraceae bacterium]
MKYGIQTMLLAAAIVFSTPALADDAPAAKPVKTQKEQMHACMQKQRTANPGLSKNELKKACENEMKTLEDHPSIPVSPNGVQ